ncbi:MAG: dTDP-4-amino-4,6-dideoxygalactose transaminase [Eubacterium sp.]
MITFNKPPFMGKECDYIKEAIDNKKISGDGAFTARCKAWLEKMCDAPEVLLTTSCTHALEMAALLINIKPGDEVIMPSYTFVSTANAFVLRGAKIVFVDISPKTMNMDETLIEAAITAKTKAIVPVHYAGVACEMDIISAIAKAHGLKVVEDAAQGVMAYYKGKSLGTLGDLGCFSFHETKNYSMGEGGAIVLNDECYFQEAEVIREKGTNRSRFFRGEIDKYTWVNCGSSYLPSDLNAAYLWAQLEQAEIINQNRLASYNYYKKALTPLAEKGFIKLPFVPEMCTHNAHMFYIKAKDLEERTRLMSHMKDSGVQAIFHYVPLHTSPYGKKVGRFNGEDRYTTKESERIMRLPLYYGLSEDDQIQVVEAVKSFYQKY